MKRIKLYEEFHEYNIDDICAGYGIENYTINKDGSIDVDGDVNLYSKKLTEIPLIFNKVSGHFSCSHNRLVSLEGCPKSVGDDFQCNENHLITMDGCPNIVGGNFNCSGNELISLKGCPNNINGYFFCDGNYLTSLEGSPESIGGEFNCSYNRLTTLEGCPDSIGGTFNTVYNELNVLNGCTTHIGNEFYIKGNPVYEVWKLINDKEYLEIFLDYDMIDGNKLYLSRLNDILDMIGKPRVTSVKGYKCI